jgi:hypothetical protein
MRRLTSPGWLLKHAIVIGLVVAFLILGWWQFGRAEEGNALSLGYTFEWPFFAAFVIFMWIREMRLTLRPGGRGDSQLDDEAGADASERTATDAASRRTGEGPAMSANRTSARAATTDLAPGVTSFDVGAALAHRADQQRAGAGIDEASDYNQYLAWLAAHPDVRPGDYRRSGAASEENAHG